MPQSIPCPHGSMTPRHCMWCMADDLTYEQAMIEAIRQTIKDKTPQVDAILARRLLGQSGSKE
jgi:hypothetical protein